MYCSINILHEIKYIDVTNWLIADTFRHRMWTYLEHIFYVNFDSIVGYKAWPLSLCNLYIFKILLQLYSELFSPIFTFTCISTKLHTSYLQKYARTWAVKTTGQGLHNLICNMMQKRSSTHSPISKCRYKKGNLFDTKRTCRYYWFSIFHGMVNL